MGPCAGLWRCHRHPGWPRGYKHRKEIERTLQEIADQMDAWDGSEEFFHDEDTIVHSVNDTPVEQPDAPQDEAEETAADESDFVDSDDAPQPDPEAAPEA